MGKTHMVEFAFGGTGQNSHWGAPYNPWDPDAHRAPGGSSSGAGVSLLEGSALLAFGSDTAGSVRIPACMTGNVGLKVTLGRWSTEGVVPLSPTFDTPGLLARALSQNP
jgi:aspartyl-tRNA(Asn)/glutamyl-tRNA(Gln) amidotransferase subunit A